MKSVHSFLWLLTLLLMLSSTSRAQAQTGLNYERDLTVTVATETRNPAFVYGKLTNKSANAYPCVRVMLNLRGPAWEEHIGTLPVYVRNLKAHETRDYKQLLPFAASGSFKHVGECEWEDDPANFPHIISFTVTPARIRRGQIARLEWRTFNTTDALLAQRDNGPRRPSVSLSGWKRIKPVRSGRFYLEAKNGAFSKIAAVDVEVTR